MQQSHMIFSQKGVRINNMHMYVDSEVNTTLVSSGLSVGEGLLQC